MSATAARRLTEREYLAIERAAETKSEFFNGEMFAMSGASEEHNIIAVNATTSLHGQLRGGPCRVYAGDLRVKVGETGLYTYPDIVVACGERRFEDAHVDTLLNPTLIVEILSPITEAYDRGEKFGQYRRLESLREYVMISQDRPCVERYTRSERGEWVLAEANGLETSIHLPSIDDELALSDVYEDIEFPTGPRPRSDLNGPP